MLLKWLPSNQLQIEASELFTQYTQLVNKLYVQTNVYDLQTVMTATFSRFDASTQTWENIAESGTILVGNTAQNGMTGYLFENYIPASVFEEEGQVGLTLTAQTPTGILNGNGEMTYTVNTSGIFKIYINRSLDNGALPVPDDLSDIIIRLQNIEDDMVKVGQTTVETETLAPGTPATFTLTRQPNGYTLVKVGIPQGLTGAAAGFAEPTATAYTVDPDEPAKVTVTASGSNTAKVFDFEFEIPQGQRGEMGGADGLIVEKEGDENMLYLTVNGEIIGTGVPIPQGGGGGTGGGGGSTGNNAVMTAQNTSGFITKVVAEDASVDLSFTWSSTENEIQTGNGSLRIIVNGSTKASLEIEQGAKTINVAPYLTAGSNKVRFEISDTYGNTRTINFTITTVVLKLESFFDGSKAYTGEIDFTYTPTGAVAKQMHFILDGNELADAPLLTVSGRLQTFKIPAQTHGDHTLEVYFTCTIDGQTVTSNKLFYDLICTVAGNNTVIISVPFNQESVLQYTTVGIPYVVYNPTGNDTEVVIKENGSTVQTLTVNNEQQTFPFKALDAGAMTLSWTAGGVTKAISFTVATQEIDVSARTENLELYLTSEGKVPGGALTWGYNGINATFSNFNNVSDGWQLDDKDIPVLRVSGNARVNIPFNIFASDLTVKGKTIEFEFTTRNVLDYETTVISSMSNGVGLKITAQQASLRGKVATTAIDTLYKDNDNVRVTFVIVPKNYDVAHPQYRVVKIFVNGIFSGVIQYADAGETFTQTPPVGISIGSNDATVDIYTIRSYDIALTDEEVLKNWIADTPDAERLFERYNRNNIFDQYGAIVPAQLPNNLPYLVLNVDNISDLPQTKGDKKTVSGYYTDPLYPSRSFTFEGAQIDVQGTSSATYYRKNYKINFANGFVVNGQNQPNYQMRSTSMPTNTFTFKADVASSEGANNVELVGLYEDICPVKTPPQQTNGMVRQGIEGHPCVIFYGNSNLKFLGKYNFNNDKGTPDVFGFESGDESWEILNNTTNLSLFKTDNFANWQQTFEARYPDKSTNIANLQAFVTWLVSTDTKVDGLTDEEIQARKTKFKNELSNYANVDALLFNYLFTEMFLLIDNRAKNAFPTRYDEDGKWLILPYDYDSAMGTNNSGRLAFGYWLEDTDFVDDEPVFNGEASVLYTNIRLCFADELKQMYTDLRTNKLFSYDEVEKRFDEHQKVWGEAIFNEDAQIKYIDPLLEENSTFFLPMLQGAKTQQRKWWLYNRFQYIDSKYVAGDAKANGNVIKLRNTEASDITLTPFADIYVAVAFDNTVVQEKATRGESVTLDYPNQEGNDGDINIYSASQLTSVGDLSALKISEGNFSAGVRLGEIIVGSEADGYTNPHLTTTFDIGALPLLRTINATNCTNLATDIDVSGCPNITTVLLQNTKVASFKSPNGGQLATLNLPDTINALTLRNQGEMTTFTIGSWANVNYLWVENTPNVDTLTAVQNLAQSKATQVRLVGFNWTFANAKTMFDALELTDAFSGIGAQGQSQANAYLQGTVNVPFIYYDELATMNALYPNITVNYDSIMERPPSVTRAIVDRSINFLYSNDTITKIKQYAFQSCASLPAFNIPNAETVGSSAFKGAASLKTASLPKAQNLIPISGVAVASSLFSGCSNLESCSLDLVTNIPSSCFTSCSKIKTVYAPLATAIGSFSFKQSGIEEFDFSNITKIDSEAFQFSSIKTASLTSVTNIYSNAFNNCVSLTSVTLPATPPTLSNVNAFSGINAACVFHVPTGSLSAYQNATNWSTLTNTYTFEEV